MARLPGGALVRLALSWLVALGGAACASFSGGDVNDTSDAARSDADDAGAARDAPGADCAGWSLRHGAVIKPVERGHNGPGSCQLCKSTAEEPAAERRIAAPKAGLHTLSLWLRADDISSSSMVSFDIGLQFRETDGGPIPGQAHFQVGPIVTDWTRAETSVRVVGAPEGVVSIGIYSGQIGQCFDFDEVMDDVSP